MTYERLMREPAHLLLSCISGSRAYNLATPASDTDIKGIFVLPQKELYGLHYTPQVNNESHDEVFFEIGRFMELLSKNNPNILELLSSPAESILFRHPLMDLIKPSDFLSRLCMDSFAGYAATQLKKAKGLNKKINQTFERERKTVLSFCYVAGERGAELLEDWLAGRGYKQEDCGLVKLDHFRDGYSLYHAPGQMEGIVSGVDANDVQLSGVRKGLAVAGVLYFNKDAYSVYCREYAQYWEWVDARNETRYQSTLSHGKQYDAKNMMHTFRLLRMAEEIALYKRIQVHREDREFLLRIKAGEFAYEDLVVQVEEKMERIRAVYAASDLPDAPDPALAEEILVRIRDGFYGLGE